MTSSHEESKPSNRNFWRGDTIRLRAVEQRDLDDIMTTAEEPDTELERYEDSIGYPQSRETQRDSLKKLAGSVGKNDFLFFLIEDLRGQTVGSINSFDCVRRNGTFKYAIVVKQPFWRRGYGREAVRLLLRYFFRELRYQKCTALVYSFNQPSIRFHEALGFRFEGRLRNMYYTAVYGMEAESLVVDGQSVDQLLMAKRLAPETGDRRQGASGGYRQCKRVRKPHPWAEINH